MDVSFKLPGFRSSLGFNLSWSGQLLRPAYSSGEAFPIKSFSPIYYVLAASVAVLSWLLLARRSRKSQGQQRMFPVSHTVETKSAGLGEDPNKDRQWGEWIPVSFTYPPVPPVSQALTEIKPVPYRPFRYGEYHITMGIRTMPWESWIELDQQYASYHAIKSARIAARGADVVRVLPARPGLVAGGRAAAVELVQELAEYLVRRYPGVFEVERREEGSGGWGGLPAVRRVTIVPLGETYDLEEREPMEVAAMLIQDDLVIMIEGTDGRYYFQAGAICLPGFWRMKDKIGMPLDKIHISGHVPHYEEKLHTSLERFFRRLPLSKPVTRNNYFFQVVPPGVHAAAAAGVLDPEELAWGTTHVGSEDAFAHGTAFDRDQKVHKAAPGAAAAGALHSPAPAEEAPSAASPPPPEQAQADRKAADKPAPLVNPETLRMRSERQTLRRLPRTGAVVFTVRTYMFDVRALADERGVPGRLASAVRGWGEEVKRYKGQALYRDALLAFLDARHAAQVEAGAVRADEEVRTAYPF